MAIIRWSLLVLLCVGFAAPLGACSSSSSNVDAAVLDLSIDFSFGDLPPGCPPAAANEKGVGAVCTKGGGECPSPLICACDTTLGIVPPDNTPCVCTRFISFQKGQTCANLPDPNYCGQGAICCSYMNALALCVPTVCLENATCPILE